MSPFKTALLRPVNSNSGRGAPARLALEAVGELLRRNLHRHFALQPGVARAPHLAHAAAPQKRAQLEGA